MMLIAILAWPVVASAIVVAVMYVTVLQNRRDIKAAAANAFKGLEKYGPSAPAAPADAPRIEREDEVNAVA